VFRFSGPQRQLIFGLSSSHAAATLAIILVGFKAGIIDENILNGTIILILITCLVASFATEAAAKRIVLAGEVELPGNSDRPEAQRERILIPCAEPASAPPLLDLAVMLRENKGDQPITLVNVVENDDRAESRAPRMQRLLAEQARYAAASETKVQAVVTIDNNVSGGIIRIAKETNSNLILLGWSDRVTLLERLFGPKTDTLLRNYHKLVLVTRLMRALSAHRRILLLCPPLAEREPGFGQWVGKVHRLSKELGLRVDMLCTHATHTAVLAEAREQRLSFEPALIPQHEEPDAEMLLARHSTSTDLVVVVSARPRSISYSPAMDQLPRRVDKQFPDISLMMVYPATAEGVDHILELD
jgi:nucleotide-binding universal stress UspA family protein